MHEDRQSLAAKLSHISAEAQGNIFLQLMERVGSFGKYQVLLQVVWCTISYLAGGFTLITPFLLFQDPYSCPDTVPGSCLDHVCAMNEQERAAYLPAERTMLSVANHFGDYHCADKQQQITLIQTLMFSGFPIGILLLALLAGRVTKKNILLANMNLSVLGLVLVILGNGPWVAGAGMFCCMLGLNMSMHTTFPFLAETVSQAYRGRLLMLLCVFDTLGGLANVLWFYLLRRYDLVLIYFYLVPALLVILGLIYLVRDTPICMVSKSSPGRAFEGLRYIAKLNGRAKMDLTLPELVEIQNNYRNTSAGQKQAGRHFGVIDLFRFKSLRMMTLLMMFVDCSVALQYYAPTLMLDQFKLNIFINGLVVESSQLMSSLLSCFIVERVPRRIMTMASFTLILACSLALVFLWDQDQEEATDMVANLTVLVFIFVIQFAITNELNFFVVYINQLFPTQVRTISLALIKTCGGVMLMIESELISLSLKAGFKIMIIFSIFSALSIASSYLLPETYKKVPPDIVEELRPTHDELVSSSDLPSS